MQRKYIYDIIRDYLHGLTDKETSHKIREMIREDETARAIAEGILRMEEEFKGNEADVDAYLEEFGRKQLAAIRQHTHPGQKDRFLWVKIAAALLLLVVAGFVINMMLSKPNPVLLADEEIMDRYPVSTIVRGAAEESAYDKALELYSAGEYKQALKHFDQALTGGDEPASVIFYYGLSCLYSGDYAKAQQLLESGIISESRYSQQARWFASLALVKSGDASKAIEALHVIRSDSQHYKFKEAVQLLEALE